MFVRRRNRKRLVTRLRQPRPAIDQLIGGGSGLDENFVCFPHHASVHEQEVFPRAVPSENRHVRKLRGTWRSPLELLKCGACSVVESVPVVAALMPEIVMEPVAS